jgi:ComF family protein
MARMFTGPGASVNEPKAGLSTIARFLTSTAVGLADAWLPATCILCGSAGAAPRLDICEVCRETLPLAASPFEPHPVFARAVIPFRYAFPVDRCIKALKFSGDRAYARVLGVLLAHARRDIDAPLPDVLIPVALHSARYRERGFNQAREIARYASRCLGLPVNIRCLTRVVNTREQSGLPLFERQNNIRGAFAIARPLLPGSRVALIDDVITTGSTVSEAAAMLRAAGAVEIELWTVARAPKRRHEKTMP